MTNERWDGDERGAGISNGEAFAPPLRELLEDMAREDWNTEEPEAHLLPHLERTVGETPLTLTSTRIEDEVFVVELDRARGSWGALRQDIYRLIASVAEPTTTVVERRDGDVTTFDVTLAIVPWQTEAFPRGHGHLMRLRVLER